MTIAYYSPIAISSILHKPSLWLPRDFPMSSAPGHNYFVHRPADLLSGARHWMCEAWPFYMNKCRKTQWRNDKTWAYNHHSMMFMAIPCHSNVFFMILMGKHDDSMLRLPKPGSFLSQKRGFGSILDPWPCVWVKLGSSPIESIDIHRYLW